VARIPLVIIMRTRLSRTHRKRVGRTPCRDQWSHCSASDSSDISSSRQTLGGDNVGRLYYQPELVSEQTQSEGDSDRLQNSASARVGHMRSPRSVRICLFGLPPLHRSVYSRYTMAQTHLFLRIRREGWKPQSGFSLPKRSLPEVPPN
jgi:hypothetical protein